MSTTNHYSTIKNPALGRSVRSEQTLVPPNSLVSVVIPTYNRAHCVVDALDSVQEQSYRPIEIILVDDGSTDETETAVMKWLKQSRFESGAADKLRAEGSGPVPDVGEIDNETSLAGAEQPPSSEPQRLTQGLTLLYLQQGNAGASAARNRGLREARGDYIQFLDSDDRLHPKRFEILVRAFEESGADFIQTSIECFDPKTNVTVNTLRARPQSDQVELVLRGDFWANALRACMRRELAKRIPPWPEAMTCFEDRIYMETAVLLAAKPIALEPMLGYLARGDGTHMSTQTRSFEGRRWRIHCERELVEQVLQREDISVELKSELASRIYRIGCRSAARGWYEYARDCVAVADRLDAPRSLYARVKRRLCLLGPVGGRCYHWICRARGLPANY